MRRAIVAAGLLALLAGLGASAQAGGLQLGTPPAERSQGREEALPVPSRPLPGRGGEGMGLLPVPGFLQGVTATITQAQRRLNQTLSQEMRRIQQTGSPAAILTVSVVAFLYGVLHAAGPGHGKLVVSAFFLGREARIIKGVMMGGLVSLLQTLSAIAIVLVLVFVLGQSGFDVVQQSVWVEVTSYGLIVLIGLYLIYAALTGRHLGHHHGETDHAHAESDEPYVHRGVVLAAGLTPCASAIIILLFALANGVLAIGMVATLIMAVGMSVTVALVGVATIATRKTLLTVMAARPRAALWVRRGLTLTGAMLITVVGSLFFASAWGRLH
jgi:nickel/cobalt exporter